MVEIDVHALAQEIAKELGDTWKPEIGAWGRNRDAFLTAGNDKRLHIGPASHRKSDEGKLCVAGRLDAFPNGKGYQEQHEINVSLSKGAARIARDIERRLLPEYLPALDAAKERQREHDEQESLREALIQDLIATLGGNARRVSWGNDSVTYGSFGDPVRADVRILSETVEFKVEIPRDLARLFSAEIAALSKRKKG
ncbi:hypothetical protein [Saccharopolyspora pogona]|uniref:hypothetical protein n=1 Tax=Saccharopolyspora pogona TaxID=333966 RepID=UPI001681E81A|nr:hypothetical protein [Saccharopolyspora pogona]